MNDAPQLLTRSNKRANKAVPSDFDGVTKNNDTDTIMTYAKSPNLRAKFVFENFFHLLTVEYVKLISVRI